MFDWGDGNTSFWFGPYKSGQIIEVNYTWNEKNEYELKVKAKDEHGLESEWSDPINITITKIKVRFIQLYLSKSFKRNLIL